MTSIRRTWTIKTVAAIVIAGVFGILAFWGLGTHLTSSSKPSKLDKQAAASGTASISAGSSARSASHNKSQPLWSDLNPSQQQVLAPLAPQWNELESFRKKKWLEIAAKYPRMRSDEQQRVQTRMHEWIRLTPQQRQIARESYVRTKKLDTDQKTAKWQQYQQLPEHEKQKLAAAAEQKKNVANLPRSRKAPVAAAGPAPASVLPSSAAEPAGAPAAALPMPAAPEQSEPLGGPPSYLIINNDAVDHRCTSIETPPGKHVV